MLREYKINSAQDKETKKIVGGLSPCKRARLVFLTQYNLSYVLYLCNFKSSIYTTKI